jgi:hypothetical protein
MELLKDEDISVIESIYNNIDAILSKFMTEGLRSQVH